MTAATRQSPRRLTPLSRYRTRSTLPLQRRTAPCAPRSHEGTSSIGAPQDFLRWHPLARIFLAVVGPGCRGRPAPAGPRLPLVGTDANFRRCSLREDRGTSASGRKQPSFPQQSDSGALSGSEVLIPATPPSRAPHVVKWSGGCGPKDSAATDGKKSGASRARRPRTQAPLRAPTIVLARRIRTPRSRKGETAEWTTAAAATEVAVLAEGRRKHRTCSASSFERIGTRDQSARRGWQSPLKTVAATYAYRTSRCRNRSVNVDIGRDAVQVRLRVRNAPRFLGSALVQARAPATINQAMSAG